MPTLAFDIEVYKNYLCFNFVDVYDFKNRWSFSIYKGHSDWEDLKKFIYQEDLTLVGFNSVRYDEVIIKAMLTGRTTNISEVFRFSSDMINNVPIDNFWDVYYYPVPWKSIDIMALHRLREIGVSLKFLGVIIKHPLVQDLPISPGKPIDPGDRKTVIEYCYNDCEITASAYLLSQDELKVRQTLIKLFGVDVLTDSRSAAAQKIMLQKYSERTGVPVNTLKKEQTVRQQINVRDCIPPNLLFKTKKLKNLLTALKTLVLYRNINPRSFTIAVTGTGGVIELDSGSEKNIKANDESFDIQIKNNFKYRTSVTIANKTFDVGVGGLHSRDEPGVYKTDDEWQLVLADVSSYYPSLQIVNKITPAHWGNTYLEILEEMISARLKAKELSKTDPEQDLAALALKIVINSIFGRLGDIFSPLLDAQALATVTLSGQLYLLDLVEKIAELKKTRLISANTDGVWVMVHKSELEAFRAIGDAWAARLGLILEYDYFNSLYQRDVNNYLAITDLGKVKTKGAFYAGEFDKNGRLQRPFEKGFDAPIVALAIYKYLVEGVSPEETIKNHNDVYDFMISKKVGKQFQNVRVGLDGQEKLQRTNRFIITTEGDSLIKKRKEDGSIENLVKDELVMVMNKVDDQNAKNYPIRYSYYLDRVGKILDLLYPPQKKLLEF